MAGVNKAPEATVRVKTINSLSIKDRIKKTLKKIKSLLPIILGIGTLMTAITLGVFFIAKSNNNKLTNEVKKSVDNLSSEDNDTIEETVVTSSNEDKNKTEDIVTTSSSEDNDTIEETVATSSSEIKMAVNESSNKTQDELKSPIKNYRPKKTKHR